MNNARERDFPFGCYGNSSLLPLWATGRLYTQLRLDLKKKKSARSFEWSAGLAQACLSKDSPLLFFLGSKKVRYQ